MNKLPPDFSLTKYNAYIRLAQVNDAKFIVDLRGDEIKSKFLSEISTDIKMQEDWLKNYKFREAKGEEYYFIVCDLQGNSFGTTRLYNFRGEIFFTGSWVFLDSSPEGLPIIGDILGREIAFDILKYSFCQFEVRKGNSKVLKYHKTYKPRLVDEDELNFYFELNREEFNFQKSNILKLYGYGI